MLRYTDHLGEFLMDVDSGSLKSYLDQHPQTHLIDTYFDIIVDLTTLDNYMDLLIQISGIYIDTAGNPSFVGKDGLKRKRVSFDGYSKHSFIPRRNGTIINNRGEVLDAYQKLKVGVDGEKLYLSEGTTLADLKK